MNHLIRRYQRTAFHQFFEGLEPVDRLTVLIVVPCLLVFALCVDRISHP